MSSLNSSLRRISLYFPSELSLFAVMEKNKKSFCVFFFIVVIIFYMCKESSAAATQRFQLDIGFRAESDPSAGQFQSVLTDPTGIFSFGFLKINSSKFDLAVVHVPSTLAIWTASTNQSDRGSGSVSLSFNGSLVFSDEEAGVLWSTTNTGGGSGGGDIVVLLNSSNLQILKPAELDPVIWQSFDFPSDTIVQDQKFSSTAALFSTNQRYSMKLGSNYLALFMEFGRGVKEPMYWKRTALQSKNQIVDGEGPLFAEVDPSGYIGLYQKANASEDVIPFDSFGRGIPGFRRLTIENDGNLRGYYWNGTIWDSDFAAVAELCDLPSPCGAYGLCQVGNPTCGCIDNRSNGCFTPDSGDLCASGDNFTAVRRKGVDMGNKELLGFVKVQTLEACEGLCEQNCRCWGAVYNNGSGNCYSMNYPVQTVEAVGDERMIGYFKVRDTKNGGGGKKRTKAEALLIVGVVAAVAGGVVGIYRLWSLRRRKRADGSIVEGLSPGPYKDLNSSSFGSIELAESFRK